jgi:hypothetical protein
MKLNRISFASILLNVILISTILYYVIITEYKWTPHPADAQFNSNQVDLKSTLAGKSLEQLPSVLSSLDYMHTMNIENLSIFDQDLKILDSLYPGKEMEIRSVVSLLLTDSLKTSISDSLNNFNPSFLSRLQNWQIALYYKSKSAQSFNNAFLYNAISLFWGTCVAQELSSFSRKTPKIKNDYSFNYLATRSNQYRYNVDIETDKFEKAIQNTIKKDWAHLFNASWDQASIFQKCIFGLLFILTSISYCILFSYIIDKITTRFKNH